MLIEDFLFFIIAFFTSVTNYISLKNLEKHLKHNVKQPRFYKSHFYYSKIVFKAIQLIIKENPKKNNEVFKNLVVYILSLIVFAINAYFFLICDIFKIWE
jgi:hypothetical protein